MNNYKLLYHDLNVHRTSIYVYGVKISDIINIYEKILKTLNIYENKVILNMNNGYSFIIDDIMYVFYDKKEMIDYITEKLNNNRKNKMKNILLVIK